MALCHKHQPVIGGDTAPTRPRMHGAKGAAGQFSNEGCASISNDLGVSSHKAVMHYALQERKHLLHNEVHYAGRMSDPAERLRIARLRAGFQTAKDAAEAMGFPVSTYLAHENGSRGYPAKKAFTYARKFKVREQWLLYGVGAGPGETDDAKAEVVSIIDRLPPIKRAEALGYLRGLAGSNGD